MDKYDQRLVPVAFGLQNTGAICYFNSFLQVLAGCPAFTKAVLSNSEYLHRTKTGTAIYAFVTCYSKQEPACHMTSIILEALVADLALRRPHVKFGGGQESASETLVHLLDMMEPPRAADAAAEESPITRLFLHRFRCDIACRKCKKEVSTTTDYAVNFNLFHIDQMQSPPSFAADFSRAIQIQVSTTEGYNCPTCPCAICGGVVVNATCQICRSMAVSSTATRVYSLTMIPEIVFCMFNLYVGYGGSRQARYFPDHLEFLAASKDGYLIFQMVGQIEHVGALSGGHYWARGLRSDGAVYTLNDTSVSHSKFEPTANTYIVAYHYKNKQ